MRRGVTLVEVLVGAFVGSMMLYVCVRLFVVSVRVGSSEIDRSGAETTMATIVSKLENDLQSTTAAGISLSEPGDKVVIHPMDTVTERRQVLYEDRLLYWSFVESEKRLVRSEFLTSPGRAFDTRPIRLDSTELGGLPLTGSSRVTNSIDDIVTFRVANPDGVLLPNLGSPLTVQLATIVEKADTRKVLEMSRLVRLRSSGN